VERYGPGGRAARLVANSRRDPQNQNTDQYYHYKRNFCNLGAFAFAKLPLDRAPLRFAVSVFCLQIAVAIWRWTAKHPELEPAGLAWVRAARRAIQIMEEA
jgi:hypothetical protein